MILSNRSHDKTCIVRIFLPCLASRANISTGCLLLARPSPMIFSSTGLTLMLPLAMLPRTTGIVERAADGAWVIRVGGIAALLGQSSRVRRIDFALGG